MAEPNDQRPKVQPKRRAGAALDESCPFEITIVGEPDPVLAVDAVLTLLGLTPGQKAPARRPPR